MKIFQNKLNKEIMLKKIYHMLCDMTCRSVLFSIYERYVTRFVNHIM